LHISEANSPVCIILSVGFESLKDFASTKPKIKKLKVFQSFLFEINHHFGLLLIKDESLRVQIL